MCDDMKTNATAMNDLSFNNRVFYNAGKDGEGIRVTIGSNVTKIPAYLFNPSSDSSYSPKVSIKAFIWLFSQPKPNTNTPPAFGCLTIL